MKNKIICFVFFVLFIVYFAMPVSVNASYVNNEDITGQTFTTENVLIFNVDPSNEYDLSYGIFCRGCYTLEYYNNNLLQTESIEWFIFDIIERRIILTGDDEDDNPWSSYTDTHIYKILEFNPTNETFQFGFVSSNYDAFYKTSNGNNAYDNRFEDFNFQSIIQNHPRNYNDTETVTNGETITLSRNIDYDYYYSKLASYYGENIYGSCGFVAIANLLCYYDFFYNDYFINDSSTYSNNYCSSEAFIKNVTENMLDTSSFYMSPGYSNSFHYYLIDMVAIASLGMSFPTHNNGNPKYATYESTQKNIIEDYLENIVANISSNDYTVSILNNEEDIKDEIDSGRPVILDCSDYFYENNYELVHEIKRGHAFIAYGYKELSNGETIYRCHLGWRESTHRYIDVLVKPIGTLAGVSFVYTGNDDNCNDNIYLFNHGHGNCFGVCHKHSGDDYYLDLVFENPTYGYYCPVCHYRVRDHIHSLSYTYHNLYNHYVTCPCGYSGYESHVIGIGPLPNGYYKCLYCKGFMDGGSIHNKINPPYDPKCHE